MSHDLPVIPGDNRVRFYKRDREQFGFLSNFHEAPIVIDGESWPTTEHYYQAQKSQRSEYRDAIRAAVTPGHAKRLGTDPVLPRNRSGQSWFRTSGTQIRKDWPEIKLEVMRTAVRAKFSQYPDLMLRLLGTGIAELVEDSRNDSFWGIGERGDGLNWLGRVLMEVRSTLRCDALRLNEPGITT